VYNLETYLPITSNSDLFCTHNKAIEISVFVSVWDNSNAKLIFFEFTTVRLTPLTVIEPFNG
jgi:hypothetical protein